MRTTKLLFLSLILLGLSACQKEEESSLKKNIENTPSAYAANNNSSAGVYKGVMVGSSGFFKICILNGNTDITCDFFFDNKEAMLTTTDLANWTPGQAINNAVFSGTWNGKAVSLTFSCGANGANPHITVSVPNHTVNVTAYKETSNILVKCYEGTYSISRQSGNVQGTWNFILCENLMIGYHKDSESEGVIGGTLTGTTLDMSDSQGIAKLTVTDTTVSGSFKDGDGNTVTVTGERSL